MITTFLYVTDQPEIPPSPSESAKRKASSEKYNLRISWQCSLKYFKLACTEFTFITLVMCYGVIETAYMLEVIMIADILRFMRGEINTSTNSNILASFYLTAYAVGALLGGILSGVILDKTKRFKEVVVASGIFMTVFACGFMLAVLFKSTVWSLVTNFFYGVFNGACYTCLYEIIVQHMYPCNEMALGAWITLFVSLAALFVPFTGRQIFNAVSEIGVLVLQTAVLLVATIVVACLKPNYQRYSINKQDGEAMPLVSKTTKK